MKQQPAEKDEVVELTQEQIDELDDRADAVERGEYVNGDEIIRRLRSGYTSEHDVANEESITQIERGEFVTAKQLFDELRTIRERHS
jgi:Arc/MetJ-type ribon-helix-helix transcriptional regulator